MSFQGEKIFHSVKPIKYVYKPSTVMCDYLIVVFSGFNPKGTNVAYNYIRTLQNLDINKLFILDDQGERGSYYLGHNRNFDAEASVVSLITKIANERNIPHSNIICCGSSKGGYASLYFAIKYGFGHVIAGAPQTKLGHYLYYAKEYPTFEFIAGDLSEDSRMFLDSLLFDVVNVSTKVPDILIHVGSGDHHYKGHVLPFKEQLENHGHSLRLDIKDYANHGNVSFYQELLVQTLIEKIPRLKNALRITSVNVTKRGNKFTVSTETNKSGEFAWYVYRDNEKIEVKWYTNKNKFVYVAIEKGDYHFVAFAKDSDDKVVYEKTDMYKVS